MHKLENSVTETLWQSKVKSLLVAISGGADSVALLVALCRISRRLSLRIEAVNCNFHLRGKESDQDSEFTSRLCEKLGVKLHLLEYDVNDYVRRHPKLSLEMACRELRYSDFYRIINEEGLDRVAVAHNADDDIETMMLNMLRGSGSRGLKGMDVDNGKVIRPLIGIRRKEIEEYLENLGIDYVTDSSNLTSEYRRNYIRREVLPLLENRWPGARKSLSKTVRILKEESEIIENHYQKQLEELCIDDYTLSVYSENVTTGTILRFIEPYGGNPEIADAIKQSLEKKFLARKWELTEKYEVALERDKLIIIDQQKKTIEPQFIWTKMRMTSENMKMIKSNRDHRIVYLPYNEKEYTFRQPKIGDRISPLGMRGSRLVSDIIRDAKLDRSAKSQIRVLSRKSDDEIIWVTGLKRSRYDLINENTEYCYKLEYNADELTLMR